ncbi:NUDIX hydrolase [Listeria floridensis FSL S10-1187]|uniref:8-oxo-dGTP diphosphatase n=1 Tax=Listeria floridensis FSL S10-1187 TaxID=1265817 RepID=A0ABN0RIG7_9LIST|nr:(deoxy)nucleoside triphosphate pyrophosphohydrolase [Listeria floridensis]EUJ33728.1 NUDIX hydrolase [Listeria floridensis FSL S10-1187]
MQVVAAIIENENQEFLCCQRPENKELAGFWEFPGGKVKTDESYEEALHREIAEELNCKIKIENFVGETNSIHDFGCVQIRFYMCKIISKNYYLIEHQASKWLSKESLHTLDWAPADFPILEKIK